MAVETSVRSFLDSLLTSGKALAQKGEDLAASKLGVGDDPAARDQMRKTAMAGGAGAAVLGLLLGTRGGRSIARTGVVLGGIGMLGKMAFDAYQKAVPGVVAADAPPVGDLPDAAAETRATLLTTAMIAAAKADGHIDEAERARIETHLAGLPESLHAMMSAQLAGPLDPVAVAALADSDQARREVYAVSVLVTGNDDPAEKAYLAALADALGLAPDIAAAIASEITA